MKRRSYLLGVIQVISPAERPPRAHGLCYRVVDARGHRVVTALVPLNLLIGWGRWLWWGLKHDWAPPHPQRCPRCGWGRRS